MFLLGKSLSFEGLEEMGHHKEKGTSGTEGEFLGKGVAKSRLKYSNQYKNLI